MRGESEGGAEGARAAGGISEGPRAAGGGGEAQEGHQRLYVCRHGERVDFHFGKDWMKRCFDPQGQYVRFDQNMPRTLPHRTGGLTNFSDDGPITALGAFQARMLGEALRDKRVQIAHVYSSPALRCVQTAANILEGLDAADLSIKTEAGLFEWLAWHPAGLPKFMTRAELKGAGLNVEEAQPEGGRDLWTEWNERETLGEYYDRCHAVTTGILARHQDGGHLLLVAHKGSVDVCLRQLVGGVKLSVKAFRERVKTVPYCGLACSRRKLAPPLSASSPASRGHDPRGKVGKGGQWTLCDPGISALTHGGNTRYNWKVWL